VTCGGSGRPFPENQIAFPPLNPATVAGAVAAILREPDIVDRLAAEDLGEQLVTALRGALRMQELRRAVDELRNNLQRGVSWTCSCRTCWLACGTSSN
jgi:hypothetical protein